MNRDEKRAELLLRIDRLRGVNPLTNLVSLVGLLLDILDFLVRSA